MFLQGIYPPLPTFFDSREDLDLETLRRHISRLQGTGIAGYVLLGSNGEAVHLTDGERARVVETARAAAGPAQLLVGTGAFSTRATIALCRLAAEAGGDVALVLPPHYYRGQMSQDALLTHYRAVAATSPIPVVIYNMPANAGGLDLDAPTVLAIAEHPNIIGIKDSSGNTVKLAQIVANTRPSFATLAGSAGFLLPALAAGAVGAVAALANIAPELCCAVQQFFAEGQLASARELQARLIPINTAITAGYGVPALKAALELTAGYGGIPRRPLLPLAAEEREHLARLLAAAGLAPLPA
jgi:4-hydroxy-2-oxoglutarate aldolase